jgi:ureidoacrylate peracid hydrolase
MREVAGIAFYDELDEILAPAHTALLIVDMQNDFVSPDGHFARNGKEVGRIARIIPGLVRIVDVARAAGVVVIFTRQTTLPGLASDSPAWVYFKTRDGKSPDYTMAGSWGAELIPELDPPAGTVVIEKHRPSAFLGTDLDATLRARGIESIVVAGCVTQGCVQATVTDGSYHDYYAVVVEDGVESTSSEQHENALRFLRSRYDVVAVDRLIAAWAPTRS